MWRAEEVYEGRRLRDVAVKLFFLPDGYAPASADAARWLDGVIDEASALCRVEHTNIVRFHTLFRDDSHGAVGLVMEYVAGKSLGAILRKTGAIDAAKVFDIGIHMAWALAAVHNAGLVHRDVKPDNIIEGSSGYKLVDFGIVAHGPQAGADSPPLLVGTPGFIPPE
ncbi:MAG TPA: protein kinase, partial [Polyangium sp.]|nr:protein kinase [Polyangium sp.]